MRVALLIGLALFVTGLTPDTARAGCIPVRDPITGSIVCETSEPVDEGTDPVAGAVREPGEPPPPPEHLAYIVELQAGPDGPCIGVRVVDLGRPWEEHEQQAAAEMRFIYEQAGIPPCPDQPVLPSPDEIAIQVIRRMQLPIPDPRIEPGRMLVGLTSYLETGGRRDFTHREDTVLGPIEVTASAVVHVDWGDGTRTGPHQSLGGPYPTGDITHVYQDSGAYDIVVDFEWVAEWSVGGETGTIGTGLATTSTIEDFEVEERQAVITNPDA